MKYKHQNDITESLKPRNEAIMREVAKGSTYAKVGRDFGLSASRVSAICWWEAHNALSAEMKRWWINERNWGKG
jgi:hypothetical protein